jgi:hypothetical protein
MADSIARVMAQSGAPHRLVVLAGEGHVRKWAVPDRAARRGAKPYVTVEPMFEDDLADAVQDHVADVLWVHQK